MSRFTPELPIIKSGSFVGNSTENRAIPHGLGRKPKHIEASREGYARVYRMLIPGVIEYLWSNVSSINSVTEWDDTYFYVGNSTDYWTSMNETGETFHWVAMG